MKNAATVLFIALILFSCKISYQFNGASIDYKEIKTINIKDFQNQATMVYPPLTQVFNEALKDHYTKNTKLSFTTNNPDLELEGEIVRYDLTPQAVKEDAYASQTRLTIGVRIRYYNNKRPQENKEETVSAYRDFSSNVLLNDVQDQLIEEISKDIVDQIFNMTLSNW
ncbi:LPS assembly lipoprotein LptE [Viscerimonas tarda]